jgi:propanol-preferring alcohol dehydrogenase
VQILKALTATRVLAVDVREDALRLAEKCGADATFVSGEDTADAVREATAGKGADLVLDFVANDATLALAGKLVRTLGDLTIIGAAGGVLPVGFYTVPYEASIQSTVWGSRPELAEVLALAAAGHVTPEITTFALEDAMDAYRQMADGTLQGRAVIVPSGK